MLNNLLKFSYKSFLISDTYFRLSIRLDLPRRVRKGSVGLQPPAGLKIEKKHTFPLFLKLNKKSTRKQLKMLSNTPNSQVNINSTTEENLANHFLL